jgi:hypothetical protein
VERELPTLQGADQGWNHVLIAAAQLRLGRVRESLAHAEQALAMGRRPWALCLKSICLSRLNRPDEARAVLLDAQHNMSPPLLEPLGSIENFLTEDQIFYLSLWRDAGAQVEKPLRDALAASREKSPGGESLNTAQALEALGTLLNQEGKYGESELEFRESLQIRRALQGNENTNTAFALTGLGQSLLSQEKFAEAEPVTRESLAIFEHFMSDSRETGLARDRLGRSLRGQKKYAEAEPLLLAGYEAFKQPGDSEIAQGACARLHELYQAWAKPEKAAEWEYEGERLRLAEVEAKLRKATQGGEAQALKDLAWFLATCRLAELRNATDAITLAEKAVALTSRKNAACLDTLAAACAEAGQFERAVAIQKEALSVLGVRDDRSVYEDRLQLFQAGSAYHQATTVRY